MTRRGEDVFGPLHERFDPEVLSGLKRLKISPKFEQRILGAANSIGPLPMQVILDFDVSKNPLSREFRNAFPKNCVFSSSIFCWILSEIYQRQIKGTTNSIYDDQSIGCFVRGKDRTVFLVVFYWDIELSWLIASAWRPDEMPVRDNVRRILIPQQKPYTGTF